MDPRHRGYGIVLATAMLVGMLVSAVAVSLAEATPGLFVSSENTNSVLEYDGTTGAFVTAFVPAGSGGLTGPKGLVFGPNGNLFVSSGTVTNLATQSVLEYNGTTGAFITAFVPAGSGGLSLPQGLVFGPNGNLFVSSLFTNSVLEYNGTTGAFVTAFVPAGSGGLASPAGLAFGPNGNLFVSSTFTNNIVLEYNGTTGAFITGFTGGAGIALPGGLVFGPNGNFFVTVEVPGAVLEHIGTTFAFFDLSAGGGPALPDPVALVFGPNGNFFVSDFGSNSVLEYNGTTGEFVTAFVPAGSGGLSGPFYLTFASVLTSVPEPGTGFLLLAGGVVLAMWRRCRSVRST